MKRLLFSALSAFVTFSAPSWADSPVVVELFTSQGCSSCPPADKMLHALAERDDVIALALHVDYWDYIGWKDVFAQAKFSKRQREYAVVGGRRSVYTPQMVVNGVTDVVGGKPMKLSEAISAHAANPSPVDVSLKRDGNTIIVDAVANGLQGHLLYKWCNIRCSVKHVSPVAKMRAIHCLTRMLPMIGKS